MKKTAILSGILAAVLTLAACAAPAAPAAAPEAQAPEAQAPAADESLDRVMKNGCFIVGLDDAFPPMGYRDDANEIVGFDIDMAKAVAEQMGIEVKFQPVIWDNIALEVKNRNVDVIWNGCTITDERKEVFDFSEPYMLNKQVVVVLKDAGFAALADLAGKKAGIQDGSSANIALDNNAEFKASLAAVQGYASNDKALMDLAAGRLDCVIVDTCVYGYYTQLQPDTYTILDEDLGSEEFGVAFHQDDDAFRAAFQQALDEVIANGKGKEISQKWFASSVFPG